MEKRLLRFSVFRSGIAYSFVKSGCSIYYFLRSANLICQCTDISKYFRESLGLRDKESRLKFCSRVTLHTLWMATLLRVGRGREREGGNYVQTVMLPFRKGIYSKRNGEQILTVYKRALFRKSRPFQKEFVVQESKQEITKVASLVNQENLTRVSNSLKLKCRGTVETVAEQPFIARAIVKILKLTASYLYLN